MSNRRTTYVDLHLQTGTDTRVQCMCKKARNSKQLSKWEVRCVRAPRRGNWLWPWARGGFERVIRLKRIYNF
jgi:hypothetical protein